jgi:hypothetical protein
VNKKSAIVTAGGLAASFVAGAAAVSSGWGLGRSINASALGAGSLVSSAPLKPIVKHRTIVIHRKAPAHVGVSTGQQRIVVLPPSGQQRSAPVVTTSASPTATAGDDGAESGGDD